MMNQSLLNISFLFLVRFRHGVVVWWRVERGGKMVVRNYRFGDIIVLVGSTNPRLVHEYARSARIERKIERWRWFPPPLSVIKKHPIQ